jgi:lysozyme
MTDQMQPQSGRRGSRRALLSTVAIAVLGACASAGCSSGAHDDETVQSSADALRVCPGATTTKGIDVSRYQGTVDWRKVKAAGRPFAIARVSDGIEHPDALFASNWAKMKTAGVLRGAYQFFRPSVDPQAQAKLFLDKIKAAGGLKRGDLPPVLDLETASGMPAATVVARAKTWLTQVQAKLGVKPIIYTSNGMSSIVGSSFSSYPLWVANYVAIETCPAMPGGWQAWKFWQHSQTGRVNGVSGDVDLDLFNGSLTQLKGMTSSLVGELDDLLETDDTLSIDANETDAPGVLEPIAPATPNDGSDGATLGSMN